MFEMTDVIVSFWFIPVTVCIIIPLLMLGGYSVVKLLGLFKGKRNVPEEKAQFENAAIQTEGR